MTPLPQGAHALMRFIALIFKLWLSWIHVLTNEVSKEKCAIFNNVC